MIYIFDKTQAIIKVLTNDDFTAAHLNFKINTATTFEFSLPASKALPSDSKYVATPHPLDDSKFIMLRLTERVDNTETIDYSAYELAYQELATDGYIEDKRPQNRSALNLMKIALDGSNWELNNVNVSGTATTNFYYIDRLSAISKVVDLLGGEIVFYIEIQGNAISGRYMDYLARQGADTSKVFASGSNLLTVERQSDTSGIYTAILPRGKGKEIDNGEADTSDGYGRRINISDVEWKKSSGNPLDKPKGSIVLSDPDATAEWGQINGNARLLLQTYDDIDDVNVLINSAYKTLQSVNHPQIQYSATVADVGGLSLGDTVLIMHGDRDLSYKTRVFEVKYDLLSPDQTELSLGDDLSSNSITSQINSLNAVADTTSSQTQWTINQIGRPSTTFGNTEPANPKVGDVFFKELPDGGTEIYRWNGDIWELLASPTTADDIANAVTEAVTQAKSHTDEVKQGLSTDIDTAKSQAASQASTAEANAKSAVSALDTKATNAINQAKSDINDTINAISVGGRNYVLNSSCMNASATTRPAMQSGGTGSGSINSTISYNSDSITLTYTGTGTQEWYYALADAWQNFSDTNIDKTKQYTISVDVKGTAPYAAFRISGVFSPSFAINSSTWTRLTYTFTFPASAGPNADNYFIRLNATGGNFTSGQILSFRNFKLEVGNKATDWTAAPEDVVLDYTTKDNQIKETITQYKDTNDGKVSQAQTDATTALGLVATKVSQTDYDTKTGDLSTKINDVKQTADSSAQTIADIKIADGKQDARMSEIESTASGLKSTVSDLQTTTGKQSGDISTLQQRADGFDATVTKVDNLAIGSRNYVLGTKNALSWSGTGVNNQASNDSDSTNDYTMNRTALGHSVMISYDLTIDSDMPSTASIGLQFSSYPNWDQLVISGAHNSGTYKFSRAYSMPSDTEPTQAVKIRGIANGYTGNISISNVKIEIGNVVTDWTPAPEDVESDISQVKITADSISNFVRDSSGNISSDFQTALSKTSIIAGSTLATSIQTQTSSQISSALTDNNGRIISLINQDSSGVQIAGENIILDGNVTVTNAFTVGQANIANGAIGTAQIGDAAITNAKIADLDVSKITGDVTNFIQSYWNGVYASTSINANGLSVQSGSTVTTFDSNGAHFANNGQTAHYEFGRWNDVNNNTTSSSGLYLGATGNYNSFIDILAPSGAASVVIAGTEMNYGNNTNIVKEAVNLFYNTNVRSRLLFKGNNINSSTYIEANEVMRTLNFYTDNAKDGNGNWFYFNHKVLSTGTFSSTSLLSKKNVIADYEEDALGEISKTDIVEFEYKNDVGEKHISPIIDDVNDEKDYYIPKTILGQDGEYVDMYSMISMAWKAIQQLNEKIGDK